MRRKSPRAGFTLIELMLGITVLAILLALAIPAFTGQFQKQRLKGAAERLASEIQFARSEAVAGNQNITVKVQGGTDWCIGLSDAGPCDCSVDCQIDGDDRMVPASTFDDVIMDPYDEAVTFDGVRGLPVAPPPADPFFFEGENAMRAGVRINQLGSVTVCSPAGDHKVGEYPDC